MPSAAGGTLVQSGAAPDLPAPDVTDDRELRASATRALAAGLTFLEGAQQADGSFPTTRWRLEDGAEVDLYFGEKTFFTTVFIGSVLLDVAGAEAVVERVTRFVEAHREPEWVWGYLTADDLGEPALAPDVDDTALAAMLLRAAGRAVGAADAVILSNRDRDGRFYTWITVLGAWWRSAARVRILLLRLPDLRRLAIGFRRDPQRVRGLDAGVNANVVLHLGRRPETEGAIAYLIDVVRRGEVADRWYEDPFMLWYLISRAFRRHRIEEGAALLDRLTVSRPTTPLAAAEGICIALDWAGAVTR
jgi:hypothetical protein